MSTSTQSPKERYLTMPLRPNARAAARRTSWHPCVATRRRPPVVGCTIRHSAQERTWRILVSASGAAPLQEASLFAGEIAWQAHQRRSFQIVKRWTYAAWQRLANFGILLANKSSAHGIL